VYRRRESHPGFRTELENLVGSVKGKGTNGSTVRLKVPMGQAGADCSVVPMKRGNGGGGKGAGHLHWDLVHAAADQSSGRPCANDWSELSLLGEGGNTLPGPTSAFIYEHYRSAVERLWAKPFGHDTYGVVTKSEFKGQENQSSLAGRNSIEGRQCLFDRRSNRESSSRSSRTVAGAVSHPESILR